MGQRHFVWKLCPFRTQCSRNKKMGFGWSPIIWLVGHHNNTWSFPRLENSLKNTWKKTTADIMSPASRSIYSIRVSCDRHDTADITEHWSASVLMVVNLITHKDGRYVTRAIFCLLSSAYVTIMPQLHYLHQLCKGLREYSSWIFHNVSHLQG